MSLTILGAIEVRRRTHLKGLDVCLASLQRWAPSASLVIFSRTPRGASPTLDALFARDGVEVVPIVPGSVDYGVVFSRFLHYRAWLRHQKSDDLILMIDLLDVFAQGPLSTLAPGVFQENIQIGACPFNNRWMRETWPPAVYEPLLDQPVVCAGVIAGTAEWTRGFLNAYAIDVARRYPDPLPKGYDQAFLNGYVSMHETRIVPYLNREVIHVGYTPQGALEWTGSGIRVDGIHPVLIHQYNRHAVIQSEVEALCPSP